MNSWFEKQNSHAVQLGFELPGRVLIDGRDELEIDRTAGVDLGCNLGRRRGVRPAAEARDLAEDVIERHQEEPETEHGDCQDQQSRGQCAAAYLGRLPIFARHSAPERMTPIRMNPR